MISLHDADELERLRHRLRIEPNDLRRLRNAFCKKGQSSEEALAFLSDPQRDRFRSEVAFHALTLQSRLDSHRDGASKLLFETAAGHRIESVVLRIASGRTSLCVSSQVGCAMQCRFCATGQMGWTAHLTTDEILDQVAQANQLLRAESRSIRNVVFMGMGEPLLNETNVYAALDALLSPQGFALSPAKVLVSTVGIPDAMVRCAERFPRIGMALSLHSARQSERENLIPMARRYPLPALREAIERVTAFQGRTLMIEYLLLEGRNDSDEDLAALIEFLNGLRVHVNAIPYNPISEDGGLRAADATRTRRFAAELRRAGFPATVRYSLGSDVAAACGQLVRLERAKDGNPKSS